MVFSIWRVVEARVLAFSEEEGHEGDDKEEDNANDNTGYSTTSKPTMCILAIGRSVCPHALVICA